jgi:hypothetical protein
LTQLSGFAIIRVMRDYTRLELIGLLEQGWTIGYPKGDGFVTYWLESGALHSSHPVYVPDTAYKTLQFQPGYTLDCSRITLKQIKDFNNE